MEQEGLRAAGRAGRTASNAAVSKVVIKAKEDLHDLPQLRLEERFPNLASVALKGCDARKLLDSQFTKFALETLAKLPKLTTVDLSYCEALDAAAACAALVQCSQLEELTLPEGAKMPLAALGALAQLTRLTSLSMVQAQPLDAQGLQQLSSLVQLQGLDLVYSSAVTDEALACLSQLKSLTKLRLRGCRPLQGSTLGQLAALSGLLKLDLHDCRLKTIKGLEQLTTLQGLKLPARQLQPADLAPLSALTTLTKLEALSVDITEECRALLRLPSLANLIIKSISLAAPPAPGTLQQLTFLEVLASGTLPRLLPLPKLKHLVFEEMISYGGDDGASLLVAAIRGQTRLTRLVLDQGLSQQQLQQMVAPLRQLHSLAVAFAEGETSCLAACAAFAELPLLRELMLWYVPQPAHLAMLARCSQLEELQVTWSERTMKDERSAIMLLLAALACKPGMRRLAYPWFDGTAKSDIGLQAVAQMAEQVGVQLEEY